jgi:hypothetical protein
VDVSTFTEWRLPVFLYPPTRTPRGV